MDNDLRLGLETERFGLPVVRRASPDSRAAAVRADDHKENGVRHRAHSVRADAAGERAFRGDGFAWSGAQVASAVSGWVSEMGSFGNL